MECEFSNPVNLNNESKPDYEYSKMVCTPEINELIQNPTYPDRQFFVQKTMSYGEAIMIWFLTIFTVFLIAKIIFDFFWKND